MKIFCAVYALPYISFSFETFTKMIKYKSSGWFLFKCLKTSIICDRNMTFKDFEVKNIQKKYVEHWTQFHLIKENV